MLLLTFSCWPHDNNDRSLAKHLLRKYVMKEFEAFLLSVILVPYTWVALPSSTAWLWSSYFWAGTHGPHGHNPHVPSHIWTGMSKVTGLGKELIRTESRSLISSTMWVSFHHTSCLQSSSAASRDSIICIDTSWRDAIVYTDCVSQVTFLGGVILFYFFNGHTVKLTFLLLA